MDMKQCSKCRIYKEMSEFNRNKARTDGYSNYCRDCDHERGKKHYLKYKDRYNTKHKEYWNTTYKFVDRTEWHKNYKKKQ